MFFECPTRDQPGLDHWQKKGCYNFCSFCGSMDPEQFSRLIDDFRLYQALDQETVYIVGYKLFLKIHHTRYLPLYKYKPLISRITCKLQIQDHQDYDIFEKKLRSLGPDYNKLPWEAGEC